MEEGDIEGVGLGGVQALPGRRHRPTHRVPTGTQRLLAQRSVDPVEARRGVGQPEEKAVGRGRRSLRHVDLQRQGLGLLHVGQLGAGAGEGHFGFWTGVLGGPYRIAAVEVAPAGIVKKAPIHAAQQRFGAGLQARLGIFQHREAHGEPGVVHGGQEGRDGVAVGRPDGERRGVGGLVPVQEKAVVPLHALKGGQGAGQPGPRV